MLRVAVFLLAFAAITQASVPSVPNGAKPNDQPLCNTCVNLLQYLKVVVAAPQIQEGINIVLPIICNIPLLAPVQDKCLSITKDLDALMHDLDNPAATCEALHLCDNASPHAFYTSKMFNQTRRVGDAATCTQCQSTVKRVQTNLRCSIGTGPQAYEMFPDLFQSVFRQGCPTDPAQQTKCVNAINVWVPKAWNLLVAVFADSDLMCLIAHGCPGV